MQIATEALTSAWLSGQPSSRLPQCTTGIECVIRLRNQKNAAGIL
jgi:hypothetical protein